LCIICRRLGKTFYSHKDLHTFRILPLTPTSELHHRFLTSIWNYIHTYQDLDRSFPFLCLT
jgi:hypothetical protein